MTKTTFLSAIAISLFYTTVAGAQYPILDMVAGKVVQKYQTSTCEQLWQEKAHKKQPTQQEQNFIQLLRNDSQMRNEFINKVAAPVVNKMFECGMVP